VEFSQALWTGRFDEAKRFASAAPPCFAQHFAGLVDRERALLATAPAERSALMRSATAHWQELLEPHKAARCTVTGTFLTLFQEMLLRIAYGELARAAVALEDKELAERAVQSFDRLWPRADAALFNRRLVERARHWVATGEVLPEPVEGRGAARSRAIDPSATGASGSVP
jgi:hypothetical protein